MLDKPRLRSFSVRAVCWFEEKKEKGKEANKIKNASIVRKHTSAWIKRKTKRTKTQRFATLRHIEARGCCLLPDEDPIVEVERWPTAAAAPCTMRQLANGQ